MNAIQTWTVTADMENNAEIWWSACRSQFPTIAEQLESGSVEIDDSELAALKALPGFSSGPAHAREALLYTRS